MVEKYQSGDAWIDIDDAARDELVDEISPLTERGSMEPAMLYEATSGTSRLPVRTKSSARNGSVRFFSNISRINASADVYASRETSRAECSRRVVLILLPFREPFSVRLMRRFRSLCSDPTMGNSLRSKAK